jgi:hypothetical protein
VLQNDAGREYEHIAYSTLRERYPAVEIITAEDGSNYLQLIKSEDSAAYIPLDNNKALIFERPNIDDPFRSLPIHKFISYEETERALHRILAEAASLPRYLKMSEEKYPAYVYENAERLQKKMLQESSQESKIEWIAEKENFYSACEDFFMPETETAIHKAFDTLKHQEVLLQGGIDKLDAMRDELLAVYTTARGVYSSLRVLRAGLKATLTNAICIAGSTEAYDTAILANSIITEHSIKAASYKNVFKLSIITVLVCFAIMFFLRGIISFVLMLVLCAAALLSFSYYFIVSANWIDPLIPFAGALSVCLSSFVITQSVNMYNRNKLFAHLYPYTSKSIIKKLYQNNFILPSKKNILKTNTKDGTTSFAVIAAIKDISLAPSENVQGNSVDSAQKIKTFHTRIINIFTQREAVIISAEGDTVAAAFNTPILSEAHKDKKTKTKKIGLLQKIETKEAAIKNAVAAVQELFADAAEKNITKNYRCAIDSGDCTFYFSPQLLYTASGRPLLRAKLLAAFAAKNGLKAVLTKSSYTKEDSPFIKKERSPGMTEKTGGFLYEIKV